MVAILTRRQVERFTPSGYGEDAETPVYLVAPLTWRERGAFRADLVRAGVGQYPSNQALVAAVRTSLVEAAPANLDELLAHVDAFADLFSADPLAMPAGEGEAEPDPAAMAGYEAERDRRIAVQAAYSTIEAATSAAPRVAALLAARTLYLALAPTMAVAHALRGWSDDVGLPFRRVAGVVPDDLIEQLPRDDLDAIGLLALQLQAPTETERKN